MRRDRRTKPNPGEVGLVRGGVVGSESYGARSEPRILGREGEGGRAENHFSSTAPKTGVSGVL